MADLTQRISEDFVNFDFFQAISLLEEYFQTQGHADPIASGHISFSSSDSITFPASDIAGIDREAKSVKLLLTFMGLTGISSPLPYYFAEYVRNHSENSPALKDFIAIFNKRMYSFFYRAWKKYHFMRSFSERGTDPFSQMVAAIAGISINANSDSAKLRMLAYTGIFASKSRGPSGLSTLLSDYFGHVPVTIRQFVPRWAAIPNPPTLGPGMQLGVNAIAGTSVCDVAGKFRIIVGPLNRDVYESFLPGSDNLHQLQNITQQYLTDPLAFDVEVQLQSIELIPVVLGELEARLGATASLGKSDAMSSVQSIVIE